MALLTPWYEHGRNLSSFDELFRRMDRLFGERWYESPWFERMSGYGGNWPLVNLFDTGSSLTALVEVPGFSGDDLDIQVQDNVLTVSGERTTTAPEGYRTLRQERGDQSFTRSFSLPTRVDGEKTRANLSNGLLTVTMEKHPEAQPKRIEVSVKKS